MTTSNAMTKAIAGTANTVTSASRALICTALTMPVISMAEVKVAMRSVCVTVFWILVTSLVNRVTSDAELNLSILE